MAKIPRVLMKIFGSNAGATEIGKFGSLAAGSAAYATNPLEVQELSNYLDGWFGAVIGNNSPPIEDVNALAHLYAYQLAYLLQVGVPEWDATTDYHIDSIVNSGGALFKSITNNNTGNAITDVTNWTRTESSSYNALITYAVGDMVLDSGKRYVSRIASNIGNTPSSSPIAWNELVDQAVGSLIVGAMDSAPSGFLYCDGSAISRTTYADLYSIVGDAYGYGDNSTTFNIPDMRGLIARGIDDGAGNDPDAAGRTASGTGGNTGDNIGSFQADVYGSHNHGGGNHTHYSPMTNSYYPYGAGPSQGGMGTAAGAGTYPTALNQTSGTIITTLGGNETRPKNLSFKYYIKY